MLNRHSGRGAFGGGALVLSDVQRPVCVERAASDWNEFRPLAHMEIWLFGLGLSGPYCLCARCIYVLTNSHMHSYGA